LKLLEVRFRSGRSTDTWEIQIAPESGATSSWRKWEAPLVPRDLLASLFDSDRALIDAGPWRLRLRPDAFADGSIPKYAWWELRNPASNASVLDEGWTVTELTTFPRGARSGGTVAVIGDAELGRSLEQKLAGGVSIATGEFQPKSIVAARGYGEEFMAEVQANAKRNDCPVIVWCSKGRPPESDRVEAITIEDLPLEEHAAWTERFVTKLRAGDDPEVAFAGAGLGSSAEKRAARFLRGACSPWAVEEGLPQFLPDDWYVMLDRKDQQAILNTCYAMLSRPLGTRRVQLVVSRGEKGAGLDLFRRRPPLGPPRAAASNRFVQWDVGWAEDPANEIQMLWRQVGAFDTNSFISRMNAHVRGSAQAVFWVRHDVMTAETSDGLASFARQIRIADLAAYTTSLMELASRLLQTKIRLLIHVALQGADDEWLAPLKALAGTPDAPFRITILPAMTTNVSRAELEAWLTENELPFTEQHSIAMSELSYDELIRRVVIQYPRMLHL
jgi:hypothetical protein